MYLTVLRKSFEIIKASNEFNKSRPLCHTFITFIITSTGTIFYIKFFFWYPDHCATQNNTLNYVFVRERYQVMDQLIAFYTSNWQI